MEYWNDITLEWWVQGGQADGSNIDLRILQSHILHHFLSASQDISSLGKLRDFGL